MTRINCGIKPSELSNKHLLAEHREIKRIPNCIKKGRYNLSGIPNEFTLGTGHVKFFYNKLGYLRARYIRLYAECISRGFKVESYIESFIGLPQNLLGHYKPKEKDRKLLIERLKERDLEFYNKLK